MGELGALAENPLVYFYALRVRFLLCTLRRIWPLSGGCYLPRLLLLFNGAQNAFYSPLPPPPSSNTPPPGSAPRACGWAYKINNLYMKMCVKSCRLDAALEWEVCLLNCLRECALGCLPRS